MYFKGYTCRILLLWYVSTGILSLSLRVELTSALCQKHCTNQEDLIQSNLVSPLSSKHHFIKSSMLIVVAHCGFCWFCVIVASTMNHICSLSSTFFFFLVYWGYSVFSLTWPASMQIHWNKRKRLHKKRGQLPQDWFGAQTWPPFHCFGTQIWLPWRHVKIHNCYCCRSCSNIL